MAKAFDRVEWEFLQFMMRQLGFDESWIRLIMLCISTVEYRVHRNGEFCESFKPLRGIWQGDPISPYLFLICAEGLSVILHQAQQSRKITGYRLSPQAPMISSLLFADDSLLFFHASVHDCTNIREYLHQYKRASGQLINLSKSASCFSRNVPIELQNYLGSLLYIPIVNMLDRYLGLPITLGRNKIREMQFIVDRTWNKLQSWKHKCISFAGKEVLLKSIAQSIPVYMFGIYLFP